MQKMDDKIVKGFYPSTDPADKQFWAQRTRRHILQL
jgi:hypothetical protein